MRTRLITALLLLTCLSIGWLPTTRVQAEPSAQRLAVFVDTDTGVDDAVAIALLLRAPRVTMLGITTVAGNTSADNATQNVLTLLDVAGRRLPVAEGAAAPLVFAASRVGKFIHGPDGLWFAQRPHDLASVSHDAPLAIAAAARAYPTMTLLALGPLTNIAEAIRRYPQDLARVNIVALVGAQRGGNRSPVAETNAFNDPQALDAVVKSSVNLTLITLDAFNQVQLNPTAVNQALLNARDPLLQFLAAPVSLYARAQTQGQNLPITLPDAVAALYVLRPQIAVAQGAVIAVQTDPGQTRGETVIATDPNQKVFMIADDAELSALADAVFSGQADPNVEIGKILARHPDDAQVVVSLKQSATMRELVEGAQ